jgi:predicted aspartyl protease
MPEAESRAYDPSPLRFLSISQGEKQYIALVDTGAQAEVCGLSVAELLEGETVIGPKMKVRGAFSCPQQIIRWKKCKMEIKGTAVWINFAVLPTLGPLMILGMPFLDAHRGIIDLRNNLIQLNVMGILSHNSLAFILHRSSIM